MQVLLTILSLNKGWAYVCVFVGPVWNCSFLDIYFTFLYQIPHKKRLLWETLSPIAKHCCGSSLPAIQTIPTALCRLYLQLSRNNGLIVILAAVLGDYGRGEIVNKGITLVPAQP